MTAALPHLPCRLVNDRQNETERETPLSLETDIYIHSIAIVTTQVKGPPDRLTCATVSSAIIGACAIVSGNWPFPSIPPSMTLTPRTAKTAGMVRIHVHLADAFKAPTIGL